MIRIIQPQQYRLVRDDEPRTKGVFNSSALQQSESQEDSDIEVQIVKTQQLGNERVYKIWNAILIVFVTYVIVAYYIHTHNNQNIVIDDTQYLELPTIHNAKIGAKYSSITFLIPQNNVYYGQEIGKVAQMCIKYNSNDCSREVLLHRKYLFVQVEKWFMNNLNMQNKNILIFWEQRLSLSILLLNINKQDKYKITIFIKLEDSSIFIDNLMLNLRKFGLEEHVTFMRLTQLNINVFQHYGLVVGNHQIFDKIIYPEFVEIAVREGAIEVINQIAFKFISKTNLMLFYDDQISNYSLDILGNLTNQITWISVDSNNEVIQLLQNNEKSSVLLLDNRKKQILQQNTPALSQTFQSNVFDQTQLEAFSKDLQLFYLPKLSQIHRTQQIHIKQFFLCNQNNRNDVKSGNYYRTQFKRLQILRGEQNDKASQHSHLYTFIYEYIFAAEQSNILFMLNHELLLNIVAAANRGQIYLPINLNINQVKLQKSLKLNNLIHRLHLVQLQKSELKKIVINNTISLTFLTLQSFLTFQEEIIYGLNINMNIIMPINHSKQQKKIFDSLSQSFFVFVIYQSLKRKFDISCLKNFETQYFEERQYPQQSFALISKTNIQIQQINPILYGNNEAVRELKHKRYRCYQNFSLKQSPSIYNLYKEQQQMIINEQISLIIGINQQFQSMVPQVKAEEGIVQFLKQNLFASDKIAIYNQQTLSIFAIISIIKKIQTYGEIFFINFQEQTIKEINRQIDPNNLNHITYQLAEITLLNPELSSLLNDNQISVLFIEASYLQQILQFNLMRKGLTIIFKYLQQSQIEAILQKNILKAKIMQVKILENEQNKKLCLNYKIYQMKQQIFSTSDKYTIASDSWIAMIF